MSSKVMNKIALGLVVSLTLSSVVEARVGGGRSHGSSSRSSSASSGSNHSSSYSSAPSRSSNSSSSYSNGSSNQSGSNQQSNNGANSGVNWKHVAGAAAVGAGVGYVASQASANSNTNHNNNPNYNNNGDWDRNNNNNGGQATNSSSGFSWFWLLVLAGVGYFIYRRFQAKKQPSVAGGAGWAKPLDTVNRNTQNPQLNTGYNNTLNGSGLLVDGTPEAVFMRHAKNSFLHIQTMNTPSQVDGLRKYMTPDLFASISQTINSSSEVADFPTLNTQFIGSEDSSTEYTASVEFSGLVSETVNAPAIPFTEVWNFSKAKNSGEWLVAGIQQV